MLSKEEYQRITDFFILCRIVIYGFFEVIRGPLFGGVETREVLNFIDGANGKGIASLSDLYFSFSSSSKDYSPSRYQIKAKEGYTSLTSNEEYKTALRSIEEIFLKGDIIKIGWLIFSQPIRKI